MCKKKDAETEREISYSLVPNISKRIAQNNIVLQNILHKNSTCFMFGFCCLDMMPVNLQV